MYLFNVQDACFGGNLFEAARHVNVFCRLHLHYSMEIVYVKRGSVKMNVAGNERIIKSGHATLIMPFETHSFETPCESECLVFDFSPELVQDFFTQVKDKAVETRFSVFEPERSIIEFCEKALEDAFLTSKDSLVAAKSEYATCDLLHAKALLYPLCSQIYDKCCFVASENPHRFEKTFVEAIRYIGNNISADLSLTEVARALGVHHVYLSRIFKQNCGMSFTRYVNGLRCSYSSRLLRNASLCEMNIAEIAYESGFGSIRSFNREFKTVYGITPQQFRQETNLI